MFVQATRPHYDLASALGLAREPMCHGEQPAGQRPIAAQPAGVTSQFEKRGLGHVVSFVGVGQPPAGDAANQRPVPADQFGECGLVAFGGESG